MTINGTDLFTSLFDPDVPSAVIKMYFEHHYSRTGYKYIFKHFCEGSLSSNYLIIPKNKTNENLCFDKPLQ